MEACEVVKLFVKKEIVSAEPKRCGNPGYGLLKTLRVLGHIKENVLKECWTKPKGLVKKV